jgi:hypothetical protein
MLVIVIVFDASIKQIRHYAFRDRLPPLAGITHPDYSISLFEQDQE